MEVGIQIYNIKSVNIINVGNAHLCNALVANFAIEWVPRTNIMKPSEVHMYLYVERSE